jgi:hypothetical protein
MEKETKLTKKLLTSELIKGYQGNLYPKATNFKYLGTNL